MIQKYTYKKLTWIDLDNPTSDEIAGITNTFRLHPFVAEELLNKKPKPRVEFYSDYIYTVISMPNDQYISFIINKESIVTSHYASLRLSFNLDQIGIGDHAGFIFYHILKEIYANIGKDVDNIRKRLSETKELSLVSKDLIEIKQIMKPHRDILEDFSNISESFFGEKFNTQTDDLKTEFSSIHDMIMNNKELITEMREDRNTQLIAKQYETTKTLTTIAYTVFPLVLITSIFSMNLNNSPILDFKVVLAIMVGISVLMFAISKYKKWL